MPSISDDTLSKKVDAAARYAFSIILSILGYLIMHNFSQFETSVQALSNDVLAVRMKLVEIENKMITEERVKEIIKLEMK